MLKVIRAGRTLLGEVREVGELIDDDAMAWHLRKSLIEMQTVAPVSDHPSPSKCGCGRIFISEEARVASGHTCDRAASSPAHGNPYFKMSKDELLAEAERLNIDIDSLPRTQKGEVKRSGLIGAVSKAEE